MTFSELDKYIQLYKKSHSVRDDAEVVLVVQQRGSIGPTPSVRVVSIQAGFDWDSNKILLRTEVPVVKAHGQPA